MIEPCIDYLLAKFSPLDRLGNLLDYFPADAKTGALAKAVFVPLPEAGEKKEVRCCIIRRKTAEEDGSEQSYSSIRHTLWIEHLRSYGGSLSRKAFDAAIDALMESFAHDEALGGTIVERRPVKLTVSEPRFFYKFLCHYGRIELVVETVPN